MPRSTQENPNAHALYMREWRAKNLERNREISRECYFRNHEARKARMRAERAAEPERLRKERNARHQRRFDNEPEYREKHRLNGRIMRARRRWAEESLLADYFRDEIKAIYVACPAGTMKSITSIRLSSTTRRESTSPQRFARPMEFAGI